jgi:ATP-GRASP peptide maturase of grasp-with-spasm system
LYGFITTVLRHINEKAYWITDYRAAVVNKLEVLTIAKKCGLKIPYTFITNNKQDLKEAAGNESIISKSITESVFFTTKNHYYQMLTQDVSHTGEIPDLFFPSLIQRNIDKDYELRIFYLEEEFYPMAIFSQNDRQTSVDFRNYNLKRANRNVPCKIPEEEKRRLLKFTKAVNLNCGSIDMIKDTQGDYIFLEVNPNGQYGMVDVPCNYKLNRRIAQQLLSALN